MENIAINDKRGKIPPQATDIEAGILGILLMGDAIDIAAKSLTIDDFYREDHQIVFKVIIELYNKRCPVDLLTVTNKLKENNELETIGGAYYLSCLADNIISRTNIEYYIDIVKDKAYSRKIIKFFAEKIDALYSDSTDAGEVLADTDSFAQGIYDNVGKLGDAANLNSLLDQCVNELQERRKLRKQGKILGIETPITKLTGYTNGWQNAELIVIAARPGMGKTAFVLSSLKRAALQNKHVVFFSLEMSSVRLIDRLLCGMANVDANLYKNGSLSEVDFSSVCKASNELASWGITIDDKPYVNMDYIRVQSKILHKKGKCDMVIVDYLGLVESANKKGFREAEVAEMSRKAKLIAKELNVPVLLLSQLNRACEARPDKMPMLSDLRESGAIEQDADVVLMLYRPEYYDIEFDQETGESTKGLGTIIIAKNRQGQIGKIPFRYNEALTDIHD